MNQCKAQSKRERVRESGSNVNTRTCFKVRSSTSPPSRRRISTNSSTQDFPYREPPLRILGKYNLGVHNSSLKYNLSLEARHKANTRSTSQMRDRHNANTNNNHLTLEGFQLNLHNHLSLEGYKHHFRNHLSLEGYQHNHLSLEGYHKEWKVITLGDLSQPQTNFPTK